MINNVWKFSLLGLLVLIAGGYAIREHSVAASARQQNAAMLSSLQTSSAQVEELKAKVDQLMAAPKPAPEAMTAPEMQMPVARMTSKPSPTGRRLRTVQRIPRDDPRWKKFQSQLEEQQKALGEQQKAIDSTRGDLTAARTELGDSIAKTHSELVVLQRKGERNYYEFDIDKAKRYSTIGPVGIRLRKANVKHQYSDLELMVDDRSVSKKHVNIYEPAMFYSADNEQPVQVIINSISKDHIHGYVSEPKYRPAQLTAQQNGPQADAAQDNANQSQARAQSQPQTQVPPRRKLTAASK